MTTPRLTAEELARKFYEQSGPVGWEDAPEDIREIWRRTAITAADALGVELAPKREELEPCPACGGGAEIGNSGDIVVCSDLVACGVQGPDHDPSGSKWNRMCRRLSTYRPPPELEEEHPRPWRIEYGGLYAGHFPGAMIVDARGQFTVDLTVVDGENPLTPTSRDGIGLLSMLNAYNAAGAPGPGAEDQETGCDGAGDR